MEKLDVITKKVDVLPMVKYYMDQLGIYDLFAKYVQNPTRSPVDSFNYGGQYRVCITAFV